MSWLYKVIYQCRLCASTNLESLIDFGQVNLYTANTGTTLEKFEPPIFTMVPLSLLICGNCKNIQLGEVVNPEILYKNFKYKSKITSNLQQHFINLSKIIIEVLAIKETDYILDIGSNDGSFLKNFKTNAKILGIEPGVAIANEANADGIPTINQYFSKKLAEDLKKQYKSFKVIFCANTIANIDNLNEIFESVKTVLAPDGYFIIETQNGMDVINDFLIDTVYHEHLSYFTIAGLSAFIETKGMRIEYVKHHNQKGGSLQIWCTHIDGKVKLNLYDSDFSRLLSEASVLEDIKDIQQKLKRAINKTKQALEKYAGKNIIGFGASVGTNTLMHLFCENLNLTEIIDDHPAVKSLPFGRRLVSVTNTEQFFPDTSSGIIILLFAYRYYDQITIKHKGNKLFKFIKIINKASD